MDWIKATVSTTTEGIDSVSGRLLNLGINGIEIADRNDFKQFLDENRAAWDYVDESLEPLKTAETTVTFYVTDDTCGLELLQSVKHSMEELKSVPDIPDCGSLEVKSDHVKDEDWSEIWKQYFHPVPVGEKILIQPAWEKAQNPENRTIFTVNPGMSFGTGSHPTTRFCMELLESRLKPDDTVLDLGCGSGILSIVALLLGAKDATAIDIDPNAVDTAYENLALNKLPKSQYQAFAGNILTDTALQDRLGTYDIVLANIVADVIIGLSGMVRKFMKPNGFFLCSGIITERLSEVKRALTKAGFEILEIKQDSDWAAIACR